MIATIRRTEKVDKRAVCWVGDGNIGSIMGIGFPAQTGGVFQAINAYGVKAFAERAAELAERYGDDFTPPALLLEKAAKGELFL